MNTETRTESQEKEPDYSQIPAAFLLKLMEGVVDMETLKKVIDAADAVSEGADPGILIERAIRAKAAEEAKKRATQMGSKAVGVIEGGVGGFVERTITKNAERMSQNPRVLKLRVLWEAQSDEEKLAWLSQHGIMKTIALETLWTGRHFLKTAGTNLKTLVNPDSLTLESFPEFEIRSYIATGLLSLPEESAHAETQKVLGTLSLAAQAGDMVASKTDKRWLAVSKPLGYVSKALSGILPKVRENMRQFEAVVPEEIANEHDKTLDAAA
jgi:hypothetical protein